MSSFICTVFSLLNVLNQSLYFYRLSENDQIFDISLWLGRRMRWISFLLFFVMKKTLFIQWALVLTRKMTLKIDSSFLILWISVELRYPLSYCLLLTRLYHHWCACSILNQCRLYRLKLEKYFGEYYNNALYLFQFPFRKKDIKYFS